MHREPSHRIAEPSGDQSRRAPLHIADGRHTAILSLQRTLGYRAVANLIRQRDGSNATADKVSLARVPKKPDAADVKSAQVRTKLAEPLARIKAKELINTARQVEPQVTEKLRLLPSGEAEGSQGSSTRSRVRAPSSARSGTALSSAG
jgi:hypothetical protein